MEYDQKIGYGSNYEKFLLRDIFTRLIKKLDIESVLEYPANHLLGRHEAIFKDLEVSLNPSAADLVWNFCEFEKNEDPELMLKEMLNRSKKYLFIVTGNKRNIGVTLHRLWHLFAFRKWDHGEIKKMDYKKVKKELKKFKHIKLLKVGAFDIPWFVLDVYESGRFLKYLVLFRKKGQVKIKPTFYERYPFFWKKYIAHHFYLLVEKK